MNILVTGGAGYVGTRLVQKLTKHKHNVVVLDTLTYGCAIKDFKSDSSITIIQGDIRSKKDVNKALQNIDVVYHLAAISNDPTGDLNPQTTIDVNSGGTEVLLKECNKSGIKRFVYASSSSVFGIQPSENVTEETIPKPITVYSKTKLEAEQMVLGQQGFVTVAIRPATICGVSPRQRFDLAVNALCGSAYFDDVITVYGGDQRRPNLTMENMLSIYLLLLTISSDRINQQVFNAGWENSTILELAHKVNKHFYVPIIVKPTKDVRDYHICSKKIEKELGFGPLYSKYPFFTVDDAIEELKNVMNYGFFQHYKTPKYNNILVLKGN